LKKKKKKERKKEKKKTSRKKNLGWLQDLVDDPCLKNKTQKKIFFEPFYPLLHNPLYP